jgi:hypothetical protein
VPGCPDGINAVHKTAIIRNRQSLTIHDRIEQEHVKPTFAESLACMAWPREYRSGLVSLVQFSIYKMDISMASAIDCRLFVDQDCSTDEANWCDTSIYIVAFIVQTSIATADVRSFQAIALFRFEKERTLNRCGLCHNLTQCDRGSLLLGAHWLTRIASAVIDLDLRDDDDDDFYLFSESSLVHF